MKWRLTIILSVLIGVISCAQKQIEYIGCTWQIKSDMKLRSDGSYFKEGNVESYLYSIRFSDKSYNVPANFYRFFKSHNNDILNVQEYISDGNSPIHGVSTFVITREGYEESVVIFNADYKQFLYNCE